MDHLLIPWDALGIGAFWLILMAFLVALPCSQMGSFLFFSSQAQ
jgi:manganese/zinc/iron transport system permease protein